MWDPPCSLGERNRTESLALRIEGVSKPCGGRRQRDHRRKRRPRYPHRPALLPVQWRGGRFRDRAPAGFREGSEDVRVPGAHEACGARSRRRFRSGPSRSWSDGSGPAPLLTDAPGNRVHSAGQGSTLSISVKTAPHDGQVGSTFVSITWPTAAPASPAARAMPGCFERPPAIVAAARPRAIFAPTRSPTSNTWLQLLQFACISILHHRRRGGAQVCLRPAPRPPAPGLAT